MFTVRLWLILLQQQTELQCTLQHPILRDAGLINRCSRFQVSAATLGYTEAKRTWPVLPSLLFGVTASSLLNSFKASKLVPSSCAHSALYTGLHLCMDSSMDTIQCGQIWHLYGHSILRGQAVNVTCYRFIGITKIVLHWSYCRLGCTADTCTRKAMMAGVSRAQDGQRFSWAVQAVTLAQVRHGLDVTYGASLLTPLLFVCRPCWWTPALLHNLPPILHVCFTNAVSRALLLCTVYT